MTLAQKGVGSVDPIGSELSRAAHLLQALALVILLSACVVWVVVWSALPRIEGLFPVEGIGRKATVSRDALGVPAIVAQSTHDAYFTLGFVHAQDRMAQMELQRRLGAGRLAEVVGEAGLSSDRFMRTLGIHALAQKAYPLLAEETRAALDSYAAGVNAWIRQHRLRLPMEFTLLGLEPEPWTPADSLVWQKLMALQLAGNWRDDVLRAQLAKLIEPKRVQELFPATPTDSPVTLPTDKGRALLDAVPEAANPRPASNIWVISGSRTASGKPLLANDPHLGFRAPILWYLASVEAPGLNLTGATVPGVPFHIIAHNGRIAWGITATQADTIDLFVEKKAGPDHYKAPDGNRPFKSRTEVIKVKGGHDHSLVVRETRHGPVVSDLLGKEAVGAEEILAFSATLLAESDLSAQALHRLNQAGDWKAFQAALKDLQAPVLNLGYADTAGNTGFLTAGRIPVRKSGNGSLPARGWLPEGDWTGMVPWDKAPRSYNPKGGLLVNANNKVVPDGYPYLITAHWTDSHRAQRINERLAAVKPHTLATMSEIQGDVLSLQALEMRDLLAGQVFKSKAAAEAAGLLLAWDGRAMADRPEPLIMAAWVRHLHRLILGDEPFAALDGLKMPRPVLLLDILTRHRHWCDDTRTPDPEACEDLAEKALVLAMEELTAAHGKDVSNWRWGKAHPALFENPILGKVPLLSWRANLSIAAPGDDFTVNRAGYRYESDAGNFPQIHGAGLRAVFDLADLSQSRFVIATGQSGNPLSRHYGDMLEPWRDDILAWPPSRTGKAVLRLEPERPLRRGKPH